MSKHAADPVDGTAWAMAGTGPLSFWQKYQLAKPEHWPTYKRAHSLEAIYARSGTHVADPLHLSRLRRCGRCSIVVGIQGVAIKDEFLQTEQD